MTEGEFAALLYRGESESLDFKQTQYRFVGASDSEKAELLKDILAFANSWRTEPAHILIGVRETAGQKAQVLGISPSDHIDDATIQQFVSTKTNRSVRLAYEKFEYEGKHIGIVRIGHPHARPIFLKKDYGSLKAETVYIRRGSSTDVAGLDEIADMGRAESQVTEQPAIELEFAEPHTRRRLGPNPTMAVGHFRLREPPTQSPSPEGGMSRELASLMGRVTEEEARFERAKEFAHKARLTPVGLWIANRGSVTALGVRVEMLVTRVSQVRILERYNVQRGRTGGMFGVPLAMPMKGDFHLRQTAEQWELSAEIGKLQPKSEQFPYSMFFIDAQEAADLKVKVQVFADNIPEPVTVEMTIHVTVEEVETTLEEIEQAQKETDE